jgi:hypothetical protein
MARKVLIDFDLNQTSKILGAAQIHAHPAYDDNALIIQGFNGGSSAIARFLDGPGSVKSDFNSDGTWTHYSDHYMQMNAVSLNSHGVKLLSGHYVNPLLRDAILSGSFNGRNTVEIAGIINGTTAQSAATVSQLNNAVSGVTLPGGGVTNDQMNTAISGIYLLSGIILHGRLGGLSGDDHGLYARLDGARAFTSPQAGVAPVGISDFCTKNYTDTQDLVVFNYFAAAAQPTDATLTALAGLTTAASQLTKWTGVDAATQISLGAFGETLIGAADSAAARSSLALSGFYQPLDATLTALAGVSTATNQLPYFTGTDAASVTPLSASGRAVISGATIEEIRNTLDVRHIKRKVADESTALNSGFLNDNELFVAVAANTNYSIRGRVFFDSAATPDFKWKIDGPASPTRVRVFRQYILNGATGWTGVTIDTNYTAAIATTGTGTAGLVDFEVMLNNGANSGFVIFQWAQNTSSVSSTTVHKGSYLEWEVRE